MLEGVDDSYEHDVSGRLNDVTHDEEESSLQKSAASKDNLFKPMKSNKSYSKRYLGIEMAGNKESL